MSVKVAISFMLASVLTARAGWLTIAWDASPSVTNIAPFQIAYYRLWRGTAEGCCTNLIVRCVSNLYCAVQVRRSVTNWFTVTAVDNSGAESLPSDELMVPSLPPSPTGLLITVVCGGVTQVFLNPVDGAVFPRLWTNFDAAITKEWLR